MINRVGAGCAVKICGLVMDSIREFYGDKRDRKIIEVDVNERSMAAQIFCRLREKVHKRFPNLDVDYEYNRHRGRSKLLGMIDTEGEYQVCNVIPDIVVHRRNGDRYNVCVIEFKKCGVNKGRDATKLQAFTSLGDVFQYKCGLAIRLGKTLAETEVDIWCDGMCWREHVLMFDSTGRETVADMCEKIQALLSER